MLIPLFPDLMPKVTEFPWFRVDVPRDEAAEIEAAETAHQNWLNGIGHREFNVAPIGKTQSEAQSQEEDEDEDDDEEDEDNDNEEDDSDTPEEDVDMDFNPTPTILNVAPAELNTNRANIARH